MEHLETSSKLLLKPHKNDDSDRWNQFFPEPPPQDALIRLQVIHSDRNWMNNNWQFKYILDNNNLTYSLLHTIAKSSKSFSDSLHRTEALNCWWVTWMPASDHPNWLYSIYRLILMMITHFPPPRLCSIEFLLATQIVRIFSSYLLLSLLLFSQDDGKESRLRWSNLENKVD